MYKLVAHATNYKTIALIANSIKIYIIYLSLKRGTISLGLLRWKLEMHMTFENIRFHIVFIENASFSFRLHFAFTSKRSKTMIVFTENVKVERFEKDIVIMISLYRFHRKRKLLGTIQQQPQFIQIFLTRKL